MMQGLGTAWGWLSCCFSQLARILTDVVQPMARKWMTDSRHGVKVYVTCLWVLCKGCAPLGVQSLQSTVLRGSCLMQAARRGALL